MKHIYIYGWCHHDDLEFLDDAGKNELRFYSGPTLNAYPIGTDQWYDALGAASKVDIAIFAGYGTCIDKHIAPIFRDEIAARIFDAIPLKIFWSFDTHWQWQTEVQYSHHFDQFYTAQSTYAPLVPGSIYLPVGFYCAAWKELVALRPNEEGLGVVFPTYDRAYGDKSALKQLAALKLNNQGIKHDFREVSDRLDYCKTLMASTACLNIPSLGNFNFRNMEAWATNAPLLAPKSNLFCQYPDLKRRSFLFDRDFSDFDAVAQAAVTAANVDTQPLIVHKHMIMHRYIEIINNVLSTKYKLTYPS